MKQRDQIINVIENTFQVTIENCRFLKKNVNYNALKFNIRRRTKKEEVLLFFEQIGKKWGADFTIFDLDSRECVFAFKIRKMNNEKKRMRVSLDLYQSEIELLRSIAHENGHSTMKPFAEQQLRQVIKKGAIE